MISATDALVAIDVAHADGHGLAERQIAGELLGPRAPGLPALRRVNTPEPDSLGPTCVQHADGVTVADADDSGGEALGEQSGCWRQKAIVPYSVAALTFLS